MKVLIQRVSNASVSINNKIVGEIDRGLLIFLGIEKNDNELLVGRAVDRVLGYRIFADAENKMNLSVKDVGGGLLLVSQFTLAANTHKGLRPSFSSAGSPDHAEHLYNAFIQQVRARNFDIKTGIFGADMQVSLLNDGPVTFLLEF